MAIHRFLLILTLLIFLISTDSLSNASIVLNFRKVIRLNDAHPSKTLENPPLPSPVNGDKNLSTTSVDAGKPMKEKKPKDSEVANTNKTDATGAATATPPSSPEEKDKGKDEVGGTKETQVVTSESCDGLPKRCEIQNTMVACILASEKGSNQLVILVQNQADKALKVKFANPTTVDKSMQPTEVPSHQTKKINILVAEVKGNKIVLNTGKGDCKLYTTPASGKNYFNQMSFYSKQVTPIYGVYLLLLVVLVFGGTCVCCKLRKKKQQGGGIPYQELEMGLPESAAVNLESAEGWDDNWDDNWDEDNAVKSPGGHHVGSISANGLTSRSFKKDGWKADWED